MVEEPESFGCRVTCLVGLESLDCEVGVATGGGSLVVKSLLTELESLGCGV